jgi:hypothetical protein
VGIAMYICSSSRNDTYIPEVANFIHKGVHKTTMRLFNKREDVEFYEVGVFTEEWKPIPFVTDYKIMKLDYLKSVKFDVYINSSNKDKAEYICSLSKLRGNGETKTMVATKICSRFK